ncbi:hypothetical protein SAMN05421767_1122 [Granulicatella balaenopterae]|uniref:DUF7916 domain-containing protein n=1 Tax=Granulicatella balaenopterae TaxID=137733 RepID=A0A1H9K5Z0_9LACT|nr:PEP phosphonomutase [Granulicatella balaenopterae]SEQ94636.1 hypothetical protein SAMN05421767_1122 [Granulicatella balaenopterae]
MVKRILGCTTQDFQNFTKQDFKQSIKAAEGRTICSEMVAPRPTIGGELTNAEIARAAGADMMLLNALDVFHPVIWGVESGETAIKELKHLVGRPIGCNLEPIDTTANMLENRLEIEPGRICTKESLERANQLGLDFICLTGNPGTGVTNQEIIRNIALAQKHFNGLIIAGKMHGAGVNEPILTKEVVEEFIKAGADVILAPAVGTIPGFTQDDLLAIVQIAHANDTLVMSAIGTSQESSSKAIIEQIAIQNKICGVDIQHIGDAGFGGLANIENIFTISTAIRGLRHTINRIAISVNRN